MSPLELRTSRLRLLVLEPARAVDVARYYRENLTHLQPSSPAFPENVVAPASWSVRLATNQALAKVGLEYRYFLVEATSDQVVGTVNLTQIARLHAQQCQLGFGIAQALQGRGLMREALLLVLRFAFDELRLMKVRACHLPGNVRSARLLEGLGFAQEGLARRDTCIDGQWLDHVVRAALNPDPSRVRCV